MMRSLRSIGAKHFVVREGLIVSQDFIISSDPRMGSFDKVDDEKLVEGSMYAGI